MLLRTATPHYLFRLTPKPSIPKTLHSFRLCATSATLKPPSPSSSPPHPWPEWVSFVDRLKSRGYFPNSSSDEDDGDGELIYRDRMLLKDPCLSFARDRYDVFKSLSKDDIQNVVEVGCPNLVRKVVNSAKRLREYVGLEEKNVCDVCSLRGSCDRAYVKPNDSSPVQTVDIMRVLLFYALDPMVISGAVRTTNIEQAESSARRLLSMLMDLSEASPTPVHEKIPDKKEKNVTLAAKPATVISQAVGARKQDWVCPKCNFSNFARNVSCLKCNTNTPPRHVELKTVKQPVELMTGDWHCPKCKYYNFARNTQCLECKEDAPREKKQFVQTGLKKGDWNCPQCGRLNFARRTACMQCTTARPLQTLEPGEWLCSKCKYLNFKRNSKCLRCETEPVKEGSSEDDHLWVKPIPRQTSDAKGVEA